MYAIRSNSIKIVRHVIEKQGARVHLQNLKYIHYAINERNSDIIIYLINEHEKLNGCISDLTCFFNRATREPAPTKLIYILLKFYYNKYSVTSLKDRIPLDLRENIFKSVFFDHSEFVDEKIEVFKIMFKIHCLISNKILVRELLFHSSIKEDYKQIFEFLFSRFILNNETDLLIELFFEKFKEVNSQNVDILEKILESIDSKKKVYNHIIIDPYWKIPHESVYFSIYLKEFVTIKGLSCKISHPFFLKLQLLIKYSILPPCFVFSWLEHYFNMWKQSYTRCKFEFKDLII
jgi:hypothetical protein